VDKYQVAAPAVDDDAGVDNSGVAIPMVDVDAGADVVVEVAADAGGAFKIGAGAAAGSATPDKT
jgi:hypothetical protein